MLDFHLHSEYSGDCEEPCESMIESAIDKGIEIMCITDHRDLDFPDGLHGSKRFDAIDYNEYFEHWNILREKYSDKIDIRIGIEAGIEPATAERQEEVISAYPFDFVINSLHAVSWDIPKYEDLFEAFDTKTVMNMYFSKIHENICCFTDFDVIGHMDFIARYAKDKSEYVVSDHMEIIDEILRKTISLGKGIEVNSAGYRKGMANPNPVPEILIRYKELGGEIITTGSDSHHTCDVAAYLSDAYALLKSLGFNYVCAYKNRKPEFIKIS